MQLFGYTIVKTDDLDILSSDRVVLRRVIDARDTTIGRLQRENAKLLAELTPLREARERQIANLAKGAAASAAKRKRSA